VTLRDASVDAFGGLARCARGPLRERAHFLGDHGKTGAGFAARAASTAALSARMLV